MNLAKLRESGVVILPQEKTKKQEKAPRVVERLVTLNHVNGTLSFNKAMLNWLKEQDIIPQTGVIRKMGALPGYLKQDLEVLEKTPDGNTMPNKMLAGQDVLFFEVSNETNLPVISERGVGKNQTFKECITSTNISGNKHRDIEIYNCGVLAFSFDTGWVLPMSYKSGSDYVKKTRNRKVK